MKQKMGSLMNRDIDEDNKLYMYDLSEFLPSYDGPQ
jgi:hypothetical protein